MRELLKIMTCGSVDDGKSTLIGRILYDAHLLLTDQEAALANESRAKRGDDSLDYSLLLDGLIAEREQGITIDVAYRYFATDARSFIVADTPGHEEYTRNMAVGASFADLALLLVDASRGVQIQTRRHLRICELCGIRHFVFAVNKMDLAGYEEAVFRSLAEELTALASPFAPASLAIFPISAARGDNVTKQSDAMPWYDGPALLPYLEQFEAEPVPEEGFVLPIQRVSRPDDTRRFYQGQISCGSVRPGDLLTAHPNALKTHVDAILVSGAPAREASAGMAVSISLTDEIDLSRGSVLTGGTLPVTGDSFACTVLWMDDAPLLEGRRYRIKLATQTQVVTVLKILHKEDPETGARHPASRLVKNEIGVLEVASAMPLVFDSFASHRALGRFILIDLLTDQTAACGTIQKPLHRGENLTPVHTDITREIRAGRLGQTPKTIWFTGLSGSGKSTLANALEQMLTAQGLHTMLLDGDNVRLGLNRDLGFSEEDRIENIRRVAEVAKLMNDAGLIVLTAFISPFSSDRETAREIIGSGDFIEVYVSTPLSECEKRDAKGLYQKARNGEITNFTGIDSPYEPPVSPAVTIDTTGRTVQESAAEVLAALCYDKSRNGTNVQ